jgi:hypothetical protein
VQVWDESTRPVAPPAPDGVAYTERGRALGRHLVDVHDHLRGELRQIRDLLGRVKDRATSAAGARAALHQMTMRQHDWVLGGYCEAYCTMLTQHHTIEDRAVFEHLRRADAGLAPVLDRLEQEHAIIHDVIRRVDRALVALMRDPGDYAELEDAIDVLGGALLSHLAYEEQQIVEPLARHGFYAGQI